VRRSEYRCRAFLRPREWKEDYNKKYL